MYGRYWQFPFKDHAVLVWGAVGAALLGALTALQLDLVIAVGERLMNPAGQEALIRTTATAGLAGLLCWVVCALVTRAISRAARKPYSALADHLERLADGYVDRPLELRGPDPDARRLARAVAVLHQRTLASQRSEADYRTRYDNLFQQHADERRLLLGMLTGGRLNPASPAFVPRAPETVIRPNFGIPGPPLAPPEAASPETAHGGRYDSLYEDPEERLRLVSMLMRSRRDREIRESWTNDIVETSHPPFQRQAGSC